MAKNYVKELIVSLSLEKANLIVDEAIKLGRKNNMLPLTVAVLDAGGHLQSFQREDGSGILRGRTDTGGYCTQNYESSKSCWEGFKTGHIWFARENTPTPRSRGGFYPCRSCVTRGNPCVNRTSGDC